MMRIHLSVEDLDAFIDGNITRNEEEKIKSHLEDCKQCKAKYEMLTDMANYLDKEELIDDRFTERVLESLNKTDYIKRNTPIARRVSILKPVLAGVTICAFVGLAFLFGSKFDVPKNNSTKQPDNLQTTQITGQDLMTPTSVPVQNEIVNLTLYFPNTNADCVVPAEREVKIKEDQSIEEVIFYELQKGPEGIGEGAIIPEGSRLLSVETKEGVCYLNLSAEFVDNNPGGTAFEAALINSIVNSLTELPNINKVQFLIQGEKRGVYSHVIFDEPFERNESFIRTADNTSEAIENKIRVLGNKVLSAFRDKDMEALSSLVHPDKKVRFSPYTYVDIQTDMTFFSEEIKSLLDSNEVYTWGVYDGIGEPIELTYEEYFSTFVYNQDFLNAQEVIYDKYIERGNTINNIFEVYPEGHVLEYHFSGFDPEVAGIDWESLKLIFEEKDGDWYLTGVVHDQWTI